MEPDAGPNERNQFRKFRTDINRGGRRRSMREVHQSILPTDTDTTNPTRPTQTETASQPPIASQRQWQRSDRA